MTVRAAIYCRVSSAAQRERHTIASQLRDLPAFVAAQGWDLVETYTDDGMSADTGLLDARQGFARLLRDVAAKRFDVLVVVDIDRLTRTKSIEERAAILGPFQRHGVEIVTPSGGRLDLRTFFGEFYATLQALVAAEENRKRAERIMAGKLTAIARGRKPAGPTPYGYRYDRETGAWSVDDGEAAVVREIFARVIAGDTGDAIAADLHARGLRRPRGGTWIRERVFQLIRNPAYRGTWIADRVRRLEVAVPVIVDAEAWHLANDRAAARARQRRGLRRTRHVYLLEGLAVCGICGARIGIATASRRPVATPTRYICAHRRRPELAGGRRCRLPIVRAAEADDRVWRTISAFLMRPDLVARWARGGRAAAVGDDLAWRRDAAAADRRIAHLRRVEAGLLGRYRKGLITDTALDRELEQLAADRAMADQQASAARRGAASASERTERVARLETLVAALRARLENASPTERQALVAAILPPGGATLTDHGPIELRVLLAETAARPTMSLVGPRSCSPSPESLDAITLTYRLVA